MTSSAPIVISSSYESDTERVVTVKKSNKCKKSKVFEYFSQMMLQKQDPKDSMASFLVPRHKDLPFCTQVLKDKMVNKLKEDIPSREIKLDPIDAMYK